MANRKYTFIDLFAGCGGLSEGFYRMGFKALAHIEINHWACETLRARMRYYGYKNIDKEVIEHDITAPDIINKIDEAVAGRTVDVIIGGPPIIISTVLSATASSILLIISGAVISCSITSLSIFL